MFASGGGPAVFRLPADAEAAAAGAGGQRDLRSGQPQLCDAAGGCAEDVPAGA